MSGKKWFKAFGLLTIIVILVLGGTVFLVDPFFHYRAPNKKIFYRLYDQRSQNVGITRFFDYDAIVTGTSMAENFRASQFDECFGTDAVKVTYSGATFKEINDNLTESYASGHQVRYVLRPIDNTMLLRDKDEMRTDMGEYPVWLTNKNPFDDVRYLLNRDVIINYTLPCVLKLFTGQEGGYTSFDEYSYTGDDQEYGKEVMLSGRKSFSEPTESFEATEEELETLRANIEQNVISLAKEHPETTFLYFYPPYSMVYWGGIREEGALTKNLAFMKEAAEMMAECENIHLYAFTGELEVTTNLDIYRDAGHYNPDINARIIEEIAESEAGGACYEVNKSFATRITADNVEAYSDELSELFESYDYNKLLED